MRDWTRGAMQRLVSPVVSLFVTSAILLCTAGASTSAADPAQAPGSRVVLDLPEGFAASPNFSGFMHVSNGTTIVLLEVPAAAFREMALGLEPELLSKKGIQNAKAGTLNRQGEYRYVTGEQPSSVGPYAKHILLFQQDPVTALVSINVPKAVIESGSADHQTFERILESARIDSNASEKPFTLGYIGPFRDTGSFIGQSHFYAYGDDPATPDPNQRPTLTIAASLDSPRIENLDATGRDGLAALAGSKAPETIESLPIEIAGLEGVEQVAPPSENGRPGLYQVILQGKDNGYYRIVGSAPAIYWSALLPEFRKISASFAPRR
jgi:hypothetical protein